MNNNAVKIALSAIVLCAAVCCPAVLASQESILHAYQQNFIRASLEAKSEILLDAATDDQAAAFMGQLYDSALVFVSYNIELLGDDPQLRYLAIIAVRGAGTTGYRHSADTLWNIFQKYQDTEIRIEVLRSLAITGKGNRGIINAINDYLLEQNKLRFSRLSINYQIISACIAALAELGDGTSFFPVFSAMIAEYSPVITSEAVAALGKFPVDFRGQLLELILNNPPAEKYAAFRIASNSSRFGQAEQGQLAQIAMEQGLDYRAANIDEINILSSLRYAAALELTRLQWTQASNLAVRHFYRVHSDFQNVLVAKERYLEAIKCLGAMGTTEAAVQAALQLGLINAVIETTGQYDPAITAAFIAVLGAIGDKSASDPLLAIEYLPYSDEIKTAATLALDRLRW